MLCIIGGALIQLKKFLLSYRCGTPLPIRWDFFIYRTMEINQILCTKDGRIFGNAIIIKKYKSPTQNKLDLYDIKTDYGSIVTGKTARELRSLFHIPEMKYHFNIEDHKHFVKI